MSLATGNSGIQSSGKSKENTNFKREELYYLGKIANKFLKNVRIRTIEAGEEII